MTPLLAMPRLGARLGFVNLLIKDESRNPTGSFKDRGMSVAVTMARYLGVRHVVIPTAGNAGGSASAYAARANIGIDVLMPNDAPFANQEECRRSGANVELVDGFLDACGRRATTLSESQGWFDLSTFKEPYRVEGKKTMAYELVEQLDGTLPDVIVYPTGGGTGLVAMWKALEELEALGWIDARRPRMISVQAVGCAPLVKAFEAGTELAQAWPNPTTRVSGLRAPKVLADALCLQTLRESGGTAIAVPDEAMFEFVRQAGASEGVSVCPEGAACLAALPELLARGDLDRDERVVVFNTAAAHKYTDLLAEFSSRKAR
jgi:threonine synthase